MVAVLVLFEFFFTFIAHSLGQFKDLIVMLGLISPIMFSGLCFEGLDSVVLPDQARVDIPVESYGFGGNGPFKGCVNLRQVRGDRLEYPAYALTSAFRKCPDNQHKFHCAIH